MFASISDFSPWFFIDSFLRDEDISNVYNVNDASDNSQ
jgi:hypothetical protein